MKSDCNPSIVCALFGSEKNINNFLDEARESGAKPRVLKFVDFSIPVSDTKKYNRAVTVLRQYYHPILQKFFNFDFPFKDKIMKMFNKKTKLQEFNYNYANKNIKKTGFYPNGFVGLTPLFVDCKRINNDDYTEIEKENNKKLLNLTLDTADKLIYPVTTPEDKFNHSPQEDKTKL